MYSDAHFHSSHPPLIDPAELPEGGLFLSCSSGPGDWEPLLKDSIATPFIGLHPEQDMANENAVLSRLERLIEENPEAGLGECGLDRRFYRLRPRALQESLLRAQIEIAVKYNRSLVLHQVAAPGALADLLKDLAPPIPVMIHGFRGSAEILQRFLNLNMYISLGPGRHWEDPVFLETARRIPRDRLLLETDWPYCLSSGSPSPSYGEVLSAHYETVSRNLGIDRELLCRLVKENGTFFKN